MAPALISHPAQEPGVGALFGVGGHRLGTFSHGVSSPGSGIISRFHGGFTSVHHGITGLFHGSTGISSRGLGSLLAASGQQAKAGNGRQRHKSPHIFISQ